MFFSLTQRTQRVRRFAKKNIKNLRASASPRETTTRETDVFFTRRRGGAEKHGIKNSYLP